MKRRGILTTLKSCITGKVIWIYRGSKGAARKAYVRTRLKENSRVRRWISFVMRRKSNINRFLGNLVSTQLFTVELPKDIDFAAHKITDVADAVAGCDYEFHKHAQRRNTLDGTQG